MDDEDERMQRAIREADAKKEAEEKGQAEWRRKMRDEIQAHRNRTVNIIFLKKKRKLCALIKRHYFCLFVCF